MRDEIRAPEELAEGLTRVVVAHMGRRVSTSWLKMHAHAQGLGQHAHLPSRCGQQPHDAEGLAADLVAARGDLAPAALVHLADAVTELPGEGDHLARR